MNTSEKLFKNLLGQPQNNDRIVSKKCIPDDDFDKIENLINTNNKEKTESKLHLSVESKGGLYCKPNNESITSKWDCDSRVITSIVNYLKDREDYMEVLSKIIYEINDYKINKK